MTGPYHTDRAQVVDLRFSGQDEPIGATAAHPFWSVTRQRFVPAGELYVGEEVVALDGQNFRLTSITPRAGPEPVFNLEIANQHTFFVSKNGLLVHNAKKCAPLSSRVTKGTKSAPPGPASSIKRASSRPNPHGKRGGPARQARVAEAQKRLDGKGGFKHEFGGSEPEHKYGNRYPDLVFKDDAGNLIAVQVGKATKAGKAIARERRAAADLLATGDFKHVFFLQYK